MVNGRQRALALDAARPRWPVPLAVTSLLGQPALLKRRYDVSGHAAERLESATAPFLAFASVVPRCRR
jgi:hypothetical protein